MFTLYICIYTLGVYNISDEYEYGRSYGDTLQYATTFKATAFLFIFVFTLKSFKSGLIGRI